MSVLIGVSAAHHFRNRPEEDLKIKRKTPIADVPQVKIKPPLHRLDLSGPTTATMNLCPSRNARLYMVAKRVVRKLTAIVGIMRYCVWARPDQ